MLTIKLDHKIIVIGNRKDRKVNHNDYIIRNQKIPKGNVTSLPRNQDKPQNKNLKIDYDN